MLSGTMKFVHLDISLYCIDCLTVRDGMEPRYPSIVFLSIYLMVLSYPKFMVNAMTLTLI